MAVWHDVPTSEGGQAAGKGLCHPPPPRSFQRPAVGRRLPAVRRAAHDVALPAAPRRAVLSEAVPGRRPVAVALRRGVAGVNRVVVSHLLPVCSWWSAWPEGRVIYNLGPAKHQFGNHWFLQCLERTGSLHRFRFYC